GRSDPPHPAWRAYAVPSRPAIDGAGGAADGPRSSLTSLPRLHWFAGGPPGLGVDGPNEHHLSAGLDHRRRPSEGGRPRAVVGAVHEVSGPPQRARTRLAAPGGPGALLSSLRRDIDPVPDRPPLQPGLQSHQDHGRDGFGAPD